MEGGWIKKRKERMEPGLQAARKIAVLPRASVARLSFKAMEIELCEKQPPPPRGHCHWNVHQYLYGFPW